MKFILPFIFAVQAHAESNVICRGNGNSALTYSASNQTFSFNAENIPATGPLPIVGDTAYRQAPGRTDLYSIFYYPLADGYNVEILWMSAETEVLRGVKPVPIYAVAKRNGTAVANFPSCQWAYN